MTLLSYWQQAFVNLGSAKLRSSLAVLGILIGTAAVVALLNCGQLATNEALAQFKALGTDLLAINVFKQDDSPSGSDHDELALSAWRSIPDKIPAILDIAPYATIYQPMSFNGYALKGAIVGADESLSRLIHLKLARGYFVSFVDSFEHYCVIGYGISQQIRQFTLDDPLGQQLRIGNTLYTIIGIAKPWQENSFFNEDINQSVIVPIAGIAMISRESRVNSAVALLRANGSIDAIIEQIKQLVLLESPKLGVFSRSAKQIIASMEKQGHIFTLLLGVIGGISLLVGGIGVMNVMLVSVSERKKEIGIRKAVGAKNHEIQYLFLMESTMLALTGGTIGIMLGIVITRVVAYWSHWQFEIYVLPLLVGFIVSVATGIFFGFYPARRASKLEPMISLRGD